MRQRNLLRKRGPLTDQVVAISAGVVQGYDLLDLTYAEDAAAVADMNMVMTGRGEVIEVQVTAEGVPISRERFDALLRLAERGIKLVAEAQKAVLLEQAQDRPAE